MSEYIATLTPNLFHPGLTHVTIPSIDWAKEGFWVNDKFEFTTASDNIYWVPASSVSFVRKWS